MAVAPKLARDVWPIIKQRVAITGFVSTLILLVIVAGALYFTGLLEKDLVLSLVILVVVGFGQAITTFIVKIIFGRPLKDLLATIIHIGGEPTDLPMPNPNKPIHERTGMKDALDTLHNLAQKVDGVLPNQQIGSVEVQNTNLGTDSLKAALDDIKAGLAIMNHERQITYHNKSTPIIVSPDGTERLQLLFDDDKNTIDSWLGEVADKEIRAEKIWRRVPNHTSDEGEQRFYDVFANYEKGTETEVVITLVDQTENYSSAEADLEFMAFAAHELRGPITVIRGYLDTLEVDLGDKLTDDHREIIRRINASTNRLASYINNILNTSRFDRRHLKLNLVETRFSDIYDTIQDDMDLRAKSQGRSLTVDIPDSLPTIAADTASMSEVITNLIDNAIKYSHEGGVVEVKGQVRGDNVEIDICDHGVGMPASIMDNLFSKFYRSHRSREAVQGTGIGLYISKAIMESHGGDIRVSSVDGEGSTFTISLPTYAITKNKLQQSPADDNTPLIQPIKEGVIINHGVHR